MEKVTDLTPKHVYRRLGIANAKHYDEIYNFMEPGQLLNGPIPQEFAEDWELASAEYF